MQTPVFPEGARVLRLSLNKEPFNVMVTGEKREEYRKPSAKNGLKWILGLLKKMQPGDTVLFRNGYNSKLPWFTAEYEGWHYAGPELVSPRRYSNGLAFEVHKGDVVIRLGAILQTGNLK